MTGAITPARLGSVVELPVAVAHLELPRSSSLVVSTVVLAAGQAVRLGWLGLHLTKASPGVPVRLQDAFGVAYAGLHAGGPVNTSPGTPLCSVSLDGPFSKVVGPLTSCLLQGPDTVDVIVANNTSNVDVELVVVGSLVLMLGGPDA